MENTASEIMRAYVNSQKFSSTAEIMEAMKDLFWDALQQVMEGELDEQLGYEARGCRNQKNRSVEKLQKWALEKEHKSAAWQGGGQCPP